jgi:hypothetical protein
MVYFHCTHLLAVVNEEIRLDESGFWSDEQEKTDRRLRLSILMEQKVRETLCNVSFEKVALPLS